MISLVPTNKTMCAAEIRRCILEHEAANDERPSGEAIDLMDSLDEAITVEMETELKSQRDLQLDVESLAAKHEALHAQVATLSLTSGNGSRADPEPQHDATESVFERGDM